MLPLAFLPNIGPTELILILLVALLLFGASRIPKIARSLGKSTNEFKKGLREGKKDDDEPEDDETSDEKSGEG